MQEPLYSKLLEQSQTPLQTFILLAQLRMLRSQEVQRRETPRETITRLFPSR